HGVESGDHFHITKLFEHRVPVLQDLVQRRLARPLVARDDVLLAGDEGAEGGRLDEVALQSIVMLGNRATEAQLLEQITGKPLHAPTVARPSCSPSRFPTSPSPLPSLTRRPAIPCPGSVAPGCYSTGMTGQLLAALGGAIVAFCGTGLLQASRNRREDRN